MQSAKIGAGESCILKGIGVPKRVPGGRNRREMMENGEPAKLAPGFLRERNFLSMAPCSPEGGGCRENMNTQTARTMKRTIVTTMSLVSLSVALVAADPNPYARPDESWISISGTVTVIHPDSFRLDYGEGIVTVEMDDWDLDADGYKLFAGDEVTVYGRVDDDLFETTSIEASSVYVDGLNTYFYASAADEEDIPAVATASGIDYDVEIRGTVSDVNGREFSVDTGHREMTVDTSLLGYNPLDDEGYQKVEEGDRVSVTGNLDITWWRDRELIADSIITPEDASG